MSFHFLHEIRAADTSKNLDFRPQKVHFIAGASEKPPKNTPFSEVSPELGHTRSACSDEKWRFFLVFLPRHRHLFRPHWKKPLFKHENWGIWCQIRLGKKVRKASRAEVRFYWKSVAPGFIYNIRGVPTILESGATENRPLGSKSMDFDPNRSNLIGFRSFGSIFDPFGSISIDFDRFRPIGSKKRSFGSINQIETSIWWHYYL